jgi:hypothetical protein
MDLFSRKIVVGQLHLACLPDLTRAGIGQAVFALTCRSGLFFR